MKYSYAFGLMTLALGSLASADDCLAKCNAAKDKCQAAPDANESTCAAEYAACLGYNPYGGAGGYVEPTACSTAMALTKPSPEAPAMTPCMTSSMPAAPASKPTGDMCVQKCNEAKDKCQAAPDANESTCAAEYAACLGYNPYGGAGGYVEPTACSTAKALTMPTALSPAKTPAPGYKPTGDMCVQKCNAAKDKCQAAPDANESTCAAEYAACLGYNPYGGAGGYVEPTACSTAMAVTMKSSTYTSMNTTCSTTMSPGKTMAAKPTGDMCVQKCNAAKDKCQAAPNANESTCAAEYASCLGYNPYEGTYVEPTACSKPAAAATPTGAHMVTAAGDRVKPAAALLALGVAVLL